MFYMDTRVLTFTIIGVFVFMLLRYWLSTALLKVQKKQAFVKEYLDVLNNPEYKVKRIQ